MALVFSTFLSEWDKGFINPPPSLIEILLCRTAQNFDTNLDLSLDKTSSHNFDEFTSNFISF